MEHPENQARYEYLASQWKNKTISPVEETELISWLNTYDEQGIQVPKELWASAAQLKKEMYAQINAAIYKQDAKQHRLWPRIAGIAAAVAAITLGVWLYYTNEVASSRNASRNDGMVVNDIAPGKNTATIKIGDGEAITLSDKQTGVVIAANSLKYNDGTDVNNPSLPARGISPQRGERAGGLTVSTPRGGTYQITLPDGTKVWLNAASDLTYTMPLNERGGIRKVELSGEAYFEVFRNKNQPFVVTTKNLTTTVLGTHFNISAYGDEQSAKTTLLEGSVKVAPHRPSATSPRGGEGLDGGKAIVLKPNQQAVVTTNTNLTVKEVDATETTAWVKGKFRFDKTPLQEVLKQMSRWYDMEVIYPDGIPDEKLSGGINRDINLSEALDMMKSMHVKFRIEGKKIIVSK